MAHSESMASVEDAFRGATSDAKGLPHAALIAMDKDGNIIQALATGTFKPLSVISGPQQPFTHNTICWLASCTKLMTTIAALQLVERGLLSLNEDIAPILPELAKVQILIDVKETGPIFRPRTRPITLRSLLTHSSGLVYESMDPKMTAWGEWVRKNYPEEVANLNSTEPAKAFSGPLLFEPGEGWAYSTGLDWVGIAVARVSGLPLTQYLKQHIWSPLGMDSTTFDLSTRPDLLSRAALMTFRADDGELVSGETALKAFGVQNGTLYVTESGGGGCFSTANDYIKLLRSIHTNDGMLLKPESVEEMFKPQLADPIHLKRYHLGPGSNPLMGNIPHETRVDFGLGGLVVMDDLERVRRREGSMQWGGMPNLFWWMSPKNGVCGCYFQQLLPPGDKMAVDMYQRFERATYSL
ncbi:beta-lactamase/transpeptidase-like protein [Dactylonectria macrodidyma]|uniref:Beta-lactamase/transpeptidase-like protein n=1 Tax=Dactylonectria macrodidyma TaxID=307937 RepID=A0A9P9IEF1_9HYPO|nr:beta-lactamase/transpeptidase-like protein [Dactylonectria macrodidyma]